MYRYVKRWCLIGLGVLSAFALTACNPYDNRGLKLVFSDDFNGTSLDLNKWSRYNSQGYVGGLRSPSAISVDGRGSLVVTAQMYGNQIISGGMSARAAYRYGRYVVRVRTETDPTATMSGVVLTWPTSNQSPPDGENDIYETGASVLRKPFYSYIHYGGVAGGSDSNYRFVHGTDGSQWHIMVMDWTPNALNLYLDGRLVGNISNKAAIPDVMHKLCIQLDTRARRTLSRPVRMYVDYVRIYQPA